MSSIDSFVEKHAAQLQILGVPESLWSALGEKIAGEIFDAGAYFCFAENPSTEANDHASVNTCNDLRRPQPLHLLVSAEGGLKKDSEIFLIDHAWSYPDIAGARKQLMENETLCERMKTMLGLDDGQQNEDQDDQDPDENDQDSKDNSSEPVDLSAILSHLGELSKDTLVLDLDDKELSSLANLGLDERFPSLLSLSLDGNPLKLENVSDVCQSILKLTQLKGLWMTNTPLYQDQETRLSYTQLLAEKLQHLEILDRKFTANYTTWAIQTISECEDLGQVEYLDLSERNILQLKPAVFAALHNIRVLNLQSNPIVAENIQVLESLSTLEELTIDYPEGKSRADVIKQLPQLKKLNGTETYFGKGHGASDRDAEIDRILYHTWAYSQTYKISGSDFYELMPTWYIMDEVGSALRHSDQPNMKVVPFFDSVKNLTYNIMWPRENIGHQEICTRDFLNFETERRDFRLYAFKLIADPSEYLQACQQKLEVRLRKETAARLQHQTSAALGRALPAINPDKTFKFAERPIRQRSEPIYVFTNSSFVRDYVKAPEFQVVGPEESHKANIIWLNNPIEFTEVTEDIMVNQFPFEACLVSKQHLAYVNRIHFGNPEYLPLTFNLQTEHDEFVAEYTRRQQSGENNLWIVKPWRLARSMDTTVSGDLLEIARQTESGPRVACKYIERPALWKGRKFDMRFIVLLKSIQPLEAYVYNEFWLRLANVPYSLDSFDEYEKHFTVMNYGRSLEKLVYTDFIAGFEQQYPHLKWKDVRSRINLAIRDVIEAATNQNAADHIPIYPNGRAMYGVDCMLTQDMEPQILEFTFSPDCTRACTYNPQFMNYIFTTLFLDDGYDPEIFTSLF